VRLCLQEKNLEFEMNVEETWARRQEFLALNPAGDVPVMVEPNGTALSGSDVICEYLEEIQSDAPLISGSPVAKAEIRRLVGWFDRKFNKEVTDNLVGEKVMKRFLGLAEPDSRAIRAGHANLPHHLDYIAYLVERRKWLAGEQMTLADLAAAAHLSAIDYLGDVPWDAHPEAKDWYARIKSRPSFRPLFADHIPGVVPAKHYKNLDF
jgi:glutathione S-transferase